MEDSANIRISKYYSANIIILDRVNNKSGKRLEKEKSNLINVNPLALQILWQNKLQFFKLMIGYFLQINITLNQH